MVGKQRRPSRNQRLMGNHQKCWIWGRHVVLETLRAGRWRPVEVLFDPQVLSAADREELETLARDASVTVLPRPAEELARLTRAPDHQGLLARMPPYPYLDEAELIAVLPPEPIVLILCGIQDPHNFGSILRSADLFQVDAVIVPRSGQADVSPHVVRSSVGAVNYLNIAQVDDLTKSANLLQSHGLSVLAATEKGDVALPRVRISGGVALLIGNEGQGVPSQLLELADQQVRIPHGGHVGSLNAAVAAGILCYEVRRRLTKI